MAAAKYHVMVFISLLLITTAAAFTMDATHLKNDLANSNADFGFKLLRELKNKKTTNIFFSPYSISTALALVYLGARGTTKLQIGQALGFSKFQNLDPVFQELRSSVFEKQKNVTLKEASRLFGEAIVDFSPKFLDANRKYYDAPLESVNFLGDPEGSRNIINDWVAKQTSNKIQNLLQQGTVTPNTLLVLVNAIYFKGDWQYQFDEKRTQNSTFRLPNSFEMDIPMMDITAWFGYTKSTDPSLEIIKLPYRGNDVSMYILLPGMYDISKLTVNRLNDLVSQMKKRRVNLKLPKFTITQHISLEQTLAGMGITRLFSSADLSGMVQSDPLSLSAFVHKAFINVNEQGTEAAAATAGIASRTRPRPPIKFHVNRPFMFLIMEETTGTILFLGYIENPVAAPTAVRTVASQLSSAVMSSAAWSMHILLIVLLICAVVQ